MLQIIDEGIRDPKNPAQVRGDLIWAFGFSRPRLRRPETVISTLAWALTDSDPFVRNEASRALVLFGADAKPAVPNLIGVLDDHRSVHREQQTYIVSVSATSTLAQMGAAARPAVPKLRSLLEHRDGRIRQQAAVALWKIGGETGGPLPVLLERLKSVSPSGNWEVLAALGEMGPAAAAALPRLKQLPQNDPGQFSKLIRETIQRIEGASVPLP